jgi:hypothetical protein
MNCDHMFWPKMSIIKSVSHSLSCKHTEFTTLCVQTTGYVATVNYKQYRDADKSLARPGRKQATATEDFEFHISYL